MEKTILLNYNTEHINQERLISYCKLHKDKILSLGFKEEKFNEILWDLKVFHLNAQNLIDMGISDQRLQIMHPLEYKSDKFTIKQLCKITRGLDVVWGEKNHFSKKNLYMTGLDDEDFEQWVIDGLYCKWSNDGKNGTNIFVAYYLTEKGINELIKIWPNMKFMWIK